MNVNFTNCSIANNTAPQGSGIFCNSSTTSNFPASGNTNSDSISCSNCPGLCNSPSSKPNNPGPNVGLIVGIVAGVVAFIAIVAFLYYRRYKKSVEYSPIK